MTPAALSSLLSRQAESVCRHLLPGGKRVGHDWVCGDFSGDKGNSLKIAIEGEKTGVGADFATGETVGDLLNVWCKVQNVGLGEAMAQACSFLGVVDDAKESRPQRVYNRPQRPQSVKRLSPQGRVLAYLKSRGLTDAALEDFRVAEDGDWIVFPYQHEGTTFNIKYLHVDRLEGGKKQIRQEKGAEPGLFGWTALDRRFPTSRFVVITEGEVDTITLHQCGVPALSVPNGGGTGHKQDWIESEYDRLNRFDTLYLCLDQDEPGEQATKEIIKRIGPERCRVVVLPHKDANECFKNGIKTFHKYLLAARSLDPAELKSADCFTDAVLDRFYPQPGSYAGMKTPWASVDDALVFRKPELVVVTGFSGSGKSTLLNYVVSKGLCDGERFCIASMEMPSRVTIWQMVRQLTGEMRPDQETVLHAMKWLRDKLWMIDIVKSVNTEKLLHIFKYAYRRYGINNFIIDSLLKCGIDEKDTDKQKQFSEQLFDLSNECDATTFLVAHARKGEDEFKPTGKSDVRGSGAITDAANTVLSVWRRKTDDFNQEQPRRRSRSTDEESSYSTLLTVCKQRETGWEGKIPLYFDSSSLQFHDGCHKPPTNYLRSVATTVNDDSF